MDVPIPTISTINRHCASERVVFGDVTYKPGGMCGPRTQPDYQIVILEQGEATVEVDDQTLDVLAQQTALMLPGRRECFRFDRHGITHHSWCAVRPDAVPDALREKLSAARAVQVLTPRLHSLIEFGLSLPASAELNAVSLIEHLGLACLYEYIFESEASHDAQAQPEALRRAIDFINGHLMEPLGLNEIAGAAYVTPQYLIRLFRKNLSITPSRYLWQMRVSRGVELLRETGLTITEISQRTGFKNPFHFSRMVKQQYHVPPRQLRKQAWGS